MKVLHVSAGNLYGGVETFLSTLAEHRGLVPEMAPEFALCFPGRQADELRSLGVPVHSLGGVRLSRPWTAWLARRRLRQLLQAGKFDFVLLHQPWIQLLFGPVLEAAGVPGVAYFHNAIGTDWQARQALKAKPRLVLAPSQFIIDSLGQAFPNAAKQAIAYPLTRGLSSPPITPERRNAIRTSLQTDAADVVIFQASRIEPWKGPDVILRALGRCREVPGWTFWFAGAPQRPHEQELFREMESLAASGGIAHRVRFLGHRNDVPDLMRAADIYCQGNRGPEGFGLSFLEACYCGLPCVTTRLGAVIEWIDPSMGLLTPPEDVYALEAAFCSLIADPEHRRTMGAAAAVRARELCDPRQQLAKIHRAMALAK